MKFLKLTSTVDNNPIFINFEKVADFYRHNDSTRIATISSDESHYSIVESPEQIMKMLEVGDE
jgi:hypothetical protein